MHVKNICELQESCIIKELNKRNQCNFINYLKHFEKNVFLHFFRE